MGFSISAILLYILGIAIFVVSFPVSLQPGDISMLLDTSERAPPFTLPWILQQNAASASAWLDRSKPDNLSATYIVYNVPGTQTRLIISVWDQTLPPVHMQSVIFKAIQYTERHMRSHPEDQGSVLDRKDDPFWMESDPGGIILGVWSTASKRLTYGELESVVKGIWKAMYQEGKYNAASIEVQTKQGGLRTIGKAVIRRGTLPPQRSED
ncbi:hypothetical protein XANCAGTX0491_008872 [Xanthoria calcicola]